MAMDTNLLNTITTLRVIIGYLGEKDQFGWWQSAFFTKGSNAFLSPLFSRTQLLAQCNGVTRAAALIHDESIGVGHVYHLFRLPEDMEQGIHQVFVNDGIERVVQNAIVGPDTALEHLNKLIIESHQPGEGPVRAGKVTDTQNEEHWQKLAGFYSHAFQENLLIFPYFTNIS